MLAIQLIILVCFYCRTTTVLGCVVHNRAMFYKNMLPKTRLTDYRILIISTQVSKQLKYLGPVEEILCYCLYGHFTMIEPLVVSLSEISSLKGCISITGKKHTKTKNTSTGPNKFTIQYHCAPCRKANRAYSFCCIWHHKNMVLQ